MQAKRSKIGSLLSYASLLFSFPFQELPHSQIILQEKKEKIILRLFCVFSCHFYIHTSFWLQLTGSQFVSCQTVIWQLAFTVQKNKCDAFKTLCHPKIYNWGSSFGAL
jgi:hypothetical protein